jgi:phage-related minor tail protein
MPTFDDATDPATGEPVVVPIVADDRQFRQTLDESEKLAKRFSSQLLGAFEAIAIKGKSLSDVFKSLALSLSKMVLQAAFKPLENAASGFLAGLFKGAFAFAKGGVLSQGTPIPFANGGVISNPISFPLAGGARGIAGERGAEAIMPLARGPDGKLGVRSAGGGAAGITINIATPDLESFQRSQTQVAAMVARAVALGQRNL